MIRSLSLLAFVSFAAAAVPFTRKGESETAPNVGKFYEGRSSGRVAIEFSQGGRTYHVVDMNKNAPTKTLAQTMCQSQGLRLIGKRDVASVAALSGKSGFGDNKGSLWISDDYCLATVIAGSEAVGRIVTRVYMSYSPWVDKMRPNDPKQTICGNLMKDNAAYIRAQFSSVIYGASSESAVESHGEGFAKEDGFAKAALPGFTAAESHIVRRQAKSDWDQLNLNGQLGGRVVCTDRP